MAKPTRKLAAIMFTDIVGYTSLMGSDEKKAFDFLKKSRRIHWRLIKKYHGRWLKEMGDGTLASFSSSVDAVLCAISIQLAAKELQIPLRIGIHQGDVVFEQKDVLGDGVNIASRIQSNSTVGCVSVSETVYQDIENKVGLETKYLGKQVLKGVQNPVSIYEVSLSDENQVEYQIDTGELTKPVDTIKKILIASIFIMALFSIGAYFLIFHNGEQSERFGIAVLPIKIIGGDTTQNYFSEGLAESMITVLANIRQLSIPSFNSVSRLYKMNESHQKIGKDLEVGFLLKGLITNRSEKLKITFRLLDAKNVRVVWNNDYESGNTQILDLPELVAKDISKYLELTLSNEELNRIERKATEKFSAYEYYLRAMHEDKKYSAEGHTNAIDFLNKALRVDPEFSEAYSLLARQYINLSVAHAKISTDDALKNALPAVQKAVEYDSLSSDAYIVHAGINYYFQWDFIEAEKNFGKALELNSWGEAPIYNCYCMPMEFLIVTFRSKEALRLIDNVRSNDPTYALAYGMESLVYLNDNDYDKALQSIREQSLLIDSWLIPMLHGIIYYYMDDYNAAQDKFEYALSVTSQRPGKLLARIAAAHYKLEDKGRMKAILEELINRHEQGEFGMGIPIANLYNEIGDEENTFKWLEIAYNNRESNFIFLKFVDFKNLREHPRYLDLLSRYGFDV